MAIHGNNKGQEEINYLEMIEEIDYIEMIEPVFKNIISNMTEESEAARNTIALNIYNLLKGSYFNYNTYISFHENRQTLRLYSTLDTIMLVSINDSILSEIENIFEKRGFFIFKRRVNESDEQQNVINTCINYNCLESAKISPTNILNTYMLELSYFNKRTNTVCKDYLNYKNYSELEDQVSKLMEFLLKKNRYDIILKLSPAINL